MSKPLGYYTSYTPGERSILGDIQNKYGSHLEGLNVREKLFFIQYICTYLANRANGNIRPEMHWVAWECTDQLEPTDMEGLLHALIEQIRAN
ncbi:hypothetical protein Riv7116_1859 [Rivularia sp. PCC 7116]|uniref:hypothetical protein n=1 Tax=Rivularia sp. PCC 7116 TaxID=373994 RepID=UPI00029ED8AB|nr:hypothetical protein [Rivularia sp. PCC 7116]AFY54400.1 hypothetical protein Riv7116_1859 [Rivularia sp. PCC 7116]